MARAARSHWNGDSKGPGQKAEGPADHHGERKDRQVEDGHGAAKGSRLARVAHGRNQEAQQPRAGADRAPNHEDLCGTDDA